MVVTSNLLTDAACIPTVTATGRRAEYGDGGINDAQALVALEHAELESNLRIQDEVDGELARERGDAGGGGDANARPTSALREALMRHRRGRGGGGAVGGGGAAAAGGGGGGGRCAGGAGGGGGGGAGNAPRNRPIMFSGSTNVVRRVRPGEGGSGSVSTAPAVASGTPTFNEMDMLDFAHAASASIDMVRVYRQRHVVCVPLS